MHNQEDIKKATKRIDQKSVDIENVIKDLDKKVACFSNWAWGFVWTGIIILVFALVIFFLDSKTYYGLNLVGDFVGGTVASIWSLAGLFFIYVAFLGQKQQLLHQQLEIMYSQLEVKYTRIELEGQKEEMIKQNETLSHQKFENTFFQLLSNHNQIVNSLDLRDKEGKITATGRDCFRTFHKYIGIHTTRLELTVPFDTVAYLRNLEFEKTIKGYEKFYSRHQSDLGHYFRNLYHIIKFIDESEIPEKKRYTNFVRAQLSSHELAVIFYNVLSVHGNDKFKPLIEKYSLLKNMNQKLIFNSDHRNKLKWNNQQN